MGIKIIGFTTPIMVSRLSPEIRESLANQGYKSRLVPMFHRVGEHDYLTYQQIGPIFGFSLLYRRHA